MKAMCRPHFSASGCSAVLAALMLAALVPALAFGAAAVTSDPLQRPAEQTALAASSVLMGVGRAGDRLVAVGERGVILRSDDSGRTWRQSPCPVSVTLTAVNFATPTAGWAVGHGGVVLGTVDGGATWRKLLDGVEIARIELAAATAQAQAAGASDAARRRLRDATQAAADGPDKPLLDVKFWSASDGLVVGAYGTILRTHDGGRTWVSLRDVVPNPKGRHFYAIQVNGAEILLAGEQGTLLRSTDQGASFAELKTPYNGTFFGVVRTAQNEILVYGLRGNVLRSTDDGLSWSKVDVGQSITVTSGSTLPGGGVALVDESGRVLLRSADTDQFRAVKLSRSFSFTGATVGRDGSLVLSGVRGTARVEPTALFSTVRP